MQPYACLYFPADLKPERLASLAEACLRFSSQVAVRPGEAVFIETGKSRWLYRQDSLGLRLLRLAQRDSPLARLRFGASPAEALALARHDAQDPARLPLEALSDYASPFCDDEPARQLALGLGPPLRALGLADLGGLLALPPQSLGSRFGPQAALLRHRVAGHWDMGWPRFERQEQPSERLSLRQAGEGGCCSLQELGFSLRLLCERLCARLRGRGERLAKLRLGLDVDVFPQREPRRLHWDLGLPLALGEARELHRVLSDALERWLGQGLPGPALALRLQALELVPGRGGQRHLFSRHEEQVEAFNAVVDRLRQRLGPDQVYLAELIQRYLPERAWKRVLQEPPAAREALPTLTALPLRPSRLLARAQPLLRVGDQLALANGRRWQAVDWQGPERLQGEWWLGPGLDRAYYRVSTREAQDLWVYQDRPDAGQALWLHGFFD
jgi:hypothetical protein